MVDTRFNLIADGYDDFLGGQDASKIPDRIAPNCYATGVNISVRRGSIQPRWGFERSNIAFQTGTIEGAYKQKRTLKELFESGKYQGAISYFIGTNQYIIIVISGFIYAFNIDSFSLIFIPIQNGGMINPRKTRVNIESAGKYLIIHDFPNFPVIIDGLNARRSDPTQMEVPVSTIGAFNENRFFIANGTDEFTAGDPVGSSATPEAPITFLEVETVGSTFFGQIFKLPTNDHNYPITYMGFLQVTDTTTGIGPLIIGTQKALYSFATNGPRENWQNSQFGNNICYNAGVVGPKAFVNTNSDAFFLGADGYLRSLAMSRNEQHAWARVPMSREVENWTKTWDKTLLPLSFVSYFNNKVFFSVNPYRMQVVDYETLYPISDYAFGGMVVMELDSLTSYGQATKPVWVGLWTGVHPMDMINFEDRAFIISKDSSRINRIYEINPNINYDTDGNHLRQIRARIYTREMDFKDPFENKELHSIDFNFDSIQGDFKIDIRYKSSHSPCFIPWKNFKHYAPWRTCEVPASCLLNGFAPHHIRDFTLGAPEGEDCSPVTNDYYRVFRKVQLELTVEGKYWEIHEIKVKAMPRPKLETESLCVELPKVEICDCCNTDWDVADFETCESLVT